ncbi:MAG TPA: cyanophycinase, partial [Ferruginibacter sp.]|nr:cyanophycinase [Ferruginibacter sp.]
MQFAKGKLIAIGGAEDKGTDLEKGEIHRNNLNFFELGILRRIVEESGGPLSRIEVITTASTIPYEVGDNYLNAFGKIGCTNVDVMHIRNRADTNNKEYQQRIATCDVVMFSGGNQLRLSSIFGGTALFQKIMERYLNDERFVIAGTSAGAMAMSNTMIYEGNAARAHLKSEVKITTGLGFMDNVIFDSHFEKRGRFVRLAQAVASNPSCIGIGLGAGWLSSAAKDPQAGACATAALGAALIAHAALCLPKVRLHVRPAQEWWLAPIVGVATGLVTASTGVFAIPSVPYLQALRL